MDLSVIIVNWNTRELLRASLASVYDTLHGVDFEVYVVDNGSTDGSQQMVREDFPQAILLENGENLGFARANNRALRLCQGEYILLLNSDAALQGDAAARLLEAAQNNPQGGIFGASLFYPDGRPQPSYGPLPTFASELASLLGLDKRLGRRGAAPAEGAPIEAGYVDGACQLLRRSMLDQIGLFDEQFFFFSEEIDLCTRAHQGGWQVLHVPAARVTHVGGGSTVSSASRTLLLYRGKLLYFKKHHGPAAQKRLYLAMRATSWLKFRAYALRRWLSRGRVAKDHIWQVVAAGLSKQEP
jgi:hypothetical protein